MQHDWFMYHLRSTYKNRLDFPFKDHLVSNILTPHLIRGGGISSSVLSVFFTDKFALSQSDARISVAYKNLSVKNTDKTLDEIPPRLTEKCKRSDYCYANSQNKKFQKASQWYQFSEERAAYHNRALIYCYFYFGTICIIIVNASTFFGQSDQMRCKNVGN